MATAREMLHTTHCTDRPDAITTRSGSAITDNTRASSGSLGGNQVARLTHNVQDTITPMVECPAPGRHRGPGHCAVDLFWDGPRWYGMFEAARSAGLFNALVIR